MRKQIIGNDYLISIIIELEKKVSFKNGKKITKHLINSYYQFHFVQCPQHATKLAYTPTHSRTFSLYILVVCVFYVYFSLLLSIHIYLLNFIYKCVTSYFKLLQSNELAKDVAYE